MMHRNSPQLHKGFSLIELLLAIFILGIGIISIATLFPAGIAQQQKTTDDIIGPIVARNAMTLIRSRVEQEDFGGAEQFESRWSPELCGFTLIPQSINPWPTICGDWMWRRPAIFKADYGEDEDFVSQNLRGGIDLFALSSDGGFGQGDTGILVEFWTDQNELPGIPYNKERYPDFYDTNGVWTGLNVPVKRVLASERQYPMWYGDPLERPKAQYHWDCMFRRYEGRILVAVFVYRIVDPSSDLPYTPDTSGLTTPDQPRRVNLFSESSTGTWNANLGGNVLVGSELDDPFLSENQWHFPGQWLIDQNGNVHHVQRGRRRSSDTYPVRLTARPSEVIVFESEENLGNAGVNVNWWDKSVGIVDSSGFISDGVVTDIWFMPTKDSLGRRIVPVYATVQEL